MGHEINFLTFDYAASKKDILREADEVYDRNCEYGGSTGGIDFREGRVFESYDEAYDWIDHYASDKFYYQGAVPYYKVVDLKPSAKLNKLKEKAAEARKKYESLANDRYLKTLSSAFVTCKGCGSKIAREKFVERSWSDRCPVCNTDFRPKTTLDRIEKARTAYEAANAAVREEEKECNRKQLKNAKKMWLVRIEYHV